MSLVTETKQEAIVQELGPSVEMMTSLFELQRVMSDEADRQLRSQFGLSSGAFEVLLALAGSTDGRLRMVDIAERNCVSRSGVTQLVDRLEAVGLVVRQTCKSDRRLVFATLTPAGRELVTTAEPVVRSMADGFIADVLTASETAALGRTLTKLLAAGRSFVPSMRPSASEQPAARRALNRQMDANAPRSRRQPKERP
jgi:DNA-binding MarR family transcriptional regulator